MTFPCPQCSDSENARVFEDARGSFVFHRCSKDNQDRKEIIAGKPYREITVRKVYAEEPQPQEVAA